MKTTHMKLVIEFLCIHHIHLSKQAVSNTLGDGDMDFANHLNAFSIPRSTGDSCFQGNELHSMGLLWPLERMLSGCPQARVSGRSQVKSQSPYEK